MLPILFLFMLTARQAQSQVWLGLHAGPCYGTFRDMGVSPISYNGIGLNVGYTVSIELERWVFEPWQQTSLLIYEDAVAPDYNFDAYGVSGHMGFTALRSVWDKGHWLLMAGGTLSNYMGAKITPSMFNAAYGITDAASLSLTGRMCFDIGRHDKDQRNYRLRFYDQLSIAPLSAMLRPGFSYIDNFSGTNSQTDALLTTYEFFPMALAECSNELGARYVMRNGNRLSLAYRWCYITTRNNGAWRYDEATHMLLATIDVNLGTRAPMRKNND